MSEGCWALVPVKNPSVGKTRLASTLSPLQRQTLVEEMLFHVLDTLKQTAKIQRIMVITSGDYSLPEDVLVYKDPGLGLNPAIEAAAQKATQEGAKQLLIIHADLPLVNSDEILQLLSRGSERGIAIAPDRHQLGTNSLVMDAALPMEFCFGEASFQKHRQKALALGINPAVVTFPGLSFDVDDANDWELLQSARSTNTQEKRAYGA